MQAILKQPQIRADDLQISHNLTTTSASAAISIANANRSLAAAQPLQILDYVAQRYDNVLFTTSFGRESAVMVDLVHQYQTINPDFKPHIVWIDHLFHTPTTYAFAQRQMVKYNLNVSIYRPTINGETCSREQIESKFNGIPNLNDPNFDAFRRLVKLDPFARVLEQYQPEVWLSGIKKTDNNQRKEMNLAMYDARGILKFSPFFNLSEDQYIEHIRARSCETYFDYFDPTKPNDSVECGLHA